MLWGLYDYISERDIRCGGTLTRRTGPFLGAQRSRCCERGRTRHTLACNCVVSMFWVAVIDLSRLRTELG